MKTFKPADILIPQNIDFSKWSVVACDQYTSEPEYWKNVREYVGDSVSTLNIIFPEVYLEDGDSDRRIKNINDTMSDYIQNDIFKTLESSYIYVERTQQNGKVRHGIVGIVDLEDYDFSKGSNSKIRATEGTIIERIPPRQKIRKNAPLELPHILMLIDDRENSVVEPVTASKSSLKKIYDFDLMMNSGHLTGYQIKNTDSVSKVLEQLERKNEEAGNSLIFAVGDGNHSLATAKTCWNEIKKNLSFEEQKTHPARFALVELMNIHDDALEFEPIQRVVFDVDPQNLMDEFLSFYKDASYENNGGQKIDFIYQEKEGSIYINNAPSNLPVGTLQKFIDEYIAKNGGSVDYIHGNDVVKNLASKENTIGFMVERMEKNDLFPTVVKDGALPRKTFSMGEACDKRFYLECKKIK